MPQIKAAVVGYGYWGPNLARNFDASGGFELVGVCDASEKRRAAAQQRYRQAGTYESLGELLKDREVEFVSVCTPVATHAEITRQALEAGCHVLCEKPLAMNVAEGEGLVELAKKVDRRLFVDHTFTYTPAVRRIRDTYKEGALGKLYYIDSVRINLGLFQTDVDVIWDLAPHDLSIVSFVVGEKVKSVAARGWSNNPRETVDVAYVDVEYESGLNAHFHLSWLSPVKVRQTIFSGADSSLVYNDVEMSEKIKIYDAKVSFDVDDIEARRQILVNYRRGDIRAPALPNAEALGTELKEIAAALRGEPATVTDGEDGLEVVRVLEATKKSLAEDGKRVKC